MPTFILSYVLLHAPTQSDTRICCVGHLLKTSNKSVTTLFNKCVPSALEAAWIGLDGLFALLFVIWDSWGQLELMISSVIKLCWRFLWSISHSFPIWCFPCCSINTEQRPFLGTQANETDQTHTSDRLRKVRNHKSRWQKAWDEAENSNLTNLSELPNFLSLMWHWLILLILKLLLMLLTCEHKHGQWMEKQPFLRIAWCAPWLLLLCCLMIPRISFGFYFLWAGLSQAWPVDSRAVSPRRDLGLQPHLSPLSKAWLNLHFMEGTFVWRRWEKAVPIPSVERTSSSWPSGLGCWFHYPVL